MSVHPAAPRRRRPFAPVTAWLFPLLLLPLMLALSRDFGATWDEPLQQRRGEEIVGYYSGAIPRIPMREDGAHLYGAGFDVLAVALQHLAGGDTYVVRHLLNAFVGWLGIVFCGLIAGRLFGPGTALLAMVLLAVTPRYFGHSMNNPKDIPFAAAGAALLYVMCHVHDRFPFFTWRSAVALAVVLALALNVRPGALLFLLYVVVLVGYRLQAQGDFRPRPVLTTALWIGGITIVTLVLGSLFWPWALERPLFGPIAALKEVSSFGWPGYMLYNGRDVLAHSTPSDYVLRWMLLTTPLVTLAGVALTLLFGREQSVFLRPAIGLWAVVLFPIVYVIGVRAVMYDGLRHLLFVQPPIAVLAAAGWMAAVRTPQVARRVSALALLLAGLLAPAVFCIREHPNEVAYFNEIAGGPAAVYGRFEMDYWGNCMLQALRKADGLAPVQVRRLLVSGWPLHLLQADASRFPRIEITDRSGGRHSLEVVLSRGSTVAVTQLARRTDILARVATADGALLCAVLPGPAHENHRRGSPAGDARADTLVRPDLDH